MWRSEGGMVARTNSRCKLNRLQIASYAFSLLQFKLNTPFECCRLIISIQTDLHSVKIFYIFQGLGLGLCVLLRDLKITEEHLKAAHEPAGLLELDRYLTLVPRRLFY